MSIVYILGSVSGMAFIGINGCYEKSKKHNCFLLLYLLTTTCLLGRTIGQWITVFYLAGFFVFAFYKRTYRILNIFGILFTYTIVILYDYLLQIVLLPFHISPHSMNLRQFSIYTAFYLPCLYLTTRLFRWFLFQVIKLQNFHRHPLMVFYLLNLAFCFIILAFHIIYGGKLGYPPNVIRFSAFLFIGYFLCNSLLFHLIYQVVKKEAALGHRLREQEQLLAYTKELEKINQNTRAFKHDYINILLTMKEYLAHGQYEELKAYYQEQILPLGYGLDQRQEQLEVLKNLASPELKGLLYGKCCYALEKGLRLRIEIPFSADRPAMDVVPLSRLLGIFLDNAVEGAQQSKEKTLEIRWYAYPSKTTIIIRNSIDAAAPPLADIRRRRFPIREGHEGIGLVNVAQILQQYPEVQWQMRREDLFFHQELQIFTKSEEKAL